MRLSPLYHWAPKRLRVQILQVGLVVMSPGDLVDNPVTGKEERVRLPWICMGTTPSNAWALLPDPNVEDPDRDGRDGWDLWMVEIVDTDRMRFRDDLGPQLKEVRVLNSIHPGRVWYVATRKGDPHL